MKLPESICMYILDNYVPIHQRLYVRQKDWVEFRDSESEMMVQMFLASDFKTSGKVLQNFLNLLTQQEKLSWSAPKKLL